MSSDLIKHVTDASFDEEVLKSEGAVLVDYWAEWCGPCKMIAPVLDEIAETYKGKLTVAKLNIDENQETPARSEEHTSELQSLMRISYAVFCLKKKKNNNVLTQAK